MLEGPLDRLLDMPINHTQHIVMCSIVRANAFDASAGQYEQQHGGWDAGKNLLLTSSKPQNTSIRQCCDNAVKLV